MTARIGPKKQALLAPLLLAMVFATAPASAAPGDLDRSFGHEGMVRLETDPSTYTFPNDMAVGPGGAIYVLRTVEVCPSGHCETERLVSRLRPNGSIDASFGTHGIATAFGLRPQSRLVGAYGASLAVSRDGHVVVAALDQEGLVLTRLNPNGSVDSSFGEQGAVRPDLGIPVGGVEVALRNDERILLGAEAASYTSESAVVVAGYTPRGAPDPDFHRGAPLFTGLNGGMGGFGLTGDGGVVVAGPRCCRIFGGAVQVARFTRHGFADLEFGPLGQRLVDHVVGNPVWGGVSGAVALRGGRIDLVGYGGRNAFALSLLPNGRFDSGFGHQGLAYTRDAFVDGPRVAIDGQGRLLMVGEGMVEHGETRSIVLDLLRRRSNGRLDRTFGGGSPVPLSLSTGIAQFFGEVNVIGVGLQSHDRPVALITFGSCVRVCFSPSEMVVRYIGGSSRARCLGQRATVVGTRAEEELVGTSGRDVIAARSGDDLVQGGGGNDLICGGRGDDRLLGGPGHDVFSGGPGRDRIQQ